MAPGRWLFLFLTCCVATALRLPPLQTPVDNPCGPPRSVRVLTKTTKETVMSSEGIVYEYDPSEDVCLVEMSSATSKIVERVPPRFILEIPQHVQQFACEARAKIQVYTAAVKTPIINMNKNANNNQWRRSTQSRGAKDLDWPAERASLKDIVVDTVSSQFFLRAAGAVAVYHLVGLILNDLFQIWQHQRV